MTHLKENLKRGIIVDAEDEQLLHSNLFHVNEGYARTTIKGKTFYLHKLLNSEYKDHKNGNTLDNRRNNLRAATHSQNSYNQKLAKNNTSGYKGVFKDKNRWRAAIMVNDSTVSLGSFKCKEQAALNYDMAAKKYFGKFAKLNFDLTL